MESLTHMAYPWRQGDIAERRVDKCGKWEIVRVLSVDSSGGVRVSELGGGTVNETSVRNLRFPRKTIR